LAFGFETLGLRRIMAHTLAENDAAVRLAEDLGFHRLGDGLYGLERDG
jgi:RimJ/RimL family protein N-acetyltransferase